MTAGGGKKTSSYNSQFFVSCALSCLAQFFFDIIDAADTAVVLLGKDEPSWRDVAICLQEYQFDMLTDRGTEYCDMVEQHDYELYLGVNGIEHTKTKARDPQINGICGRFHKTILQEFCQVAFRRKPVSYTHLDVYKRQTLKRTPSST